MPELRAVDLDRVTQSAVPVFLLHGRHDFTTPPSATATWMAQLEAPVKADYWFEHSAHLAFMEEPGKVAMTLVTCVRPCATEATLEVAKAKAAGCDQPG